MLVDANWQGRPRKLLLQANRNGFLYVLDRTDGKLLLAKPLVKKLTWAKEIGADGKPVMNPNQTPTPEGTLICPAVEGAANFFSTSYNPATGYFYVNTLEKCTVYHQDPRRRVARRPRLRAEADGVRPMTRRKRFLRAFDIQTGKVAWELPQNGSARYLDRHSLHRQRIVIFGDDGGELAAADAVTGKKLWSFPFTDSLHTSPMTYMFDHKQYVA